MKKFQTLITMLMSAGYMVATTFEGDEGHILVSLHNRDRVVGEFILEPTDDNDWTLGKASPVIQHQIAGALMYLGYADFDDF